MTFGRAVLISVLGITLIAGVSLAALFAYYRPTVEWAYVDIRKDAGIASTLKWPILIAAVVLVPAMLLWLWKRPHV